jgi:SAM-dependent methyltransferase
MADKIRARQPGKTADATRGRGRCLAPRVARARDWPGAVVLTIVLASVAALHAGWRPSEAATGAPLRVPDVRYEPTAHDVVQIMLRLANVKPGEVVYDLGCGDGRVVIAAVRQAQARGVCVDIDPRRIAESRRNAREAGIGDRIHFRNEDLYETEIGDADVVMLFLYPDVNLKLRPKLLRELRPGTRVVSHWHDMGDWQPEERVYVRSEGRGRYVYRWTIPAR